MSQSPGAAYLPPPPPKRARMPAWGIALIVLGAVVALVGLIVGAGMLFLATAEQVPVTAADRARVLTIDALGRGLADFAPDPAAATLTKTEYIDGSAEVEYEYSEDRDAAPYLMSSLTLEKKSSDAVASYVSLWGGARLSLGVFGAEADLGVEERSDLFRWGDQSKFAVITAGGAPVGNMFIARKGKLVFLTMFVGLYYDDGEAFSGLVGPVLEAISEGG